MLRQPLLEGFPFDLVFDLYIPDFLPLCLLQLLPRQQVPRPHGLHPLLATLKLPTLLLISPDLISLLLFLLILATNVQLLQQFRLLLLLLQLKGLLLLFDSPSPLFLLHYGLNLPLLLLLHESEGPHFLFDEGGVLLLEE